MTGRGGTPRRPARAGATGSARASGRTTTTTTRTRAERETAPRSAGRTTTATRTRTGRERAARSVARSTATRSRTGREAATTTRGRTDRETSARSGRRAPSASPGRDRARGGARRPGGGGSRRGGGSRARAATRAGNPRTRALGLLAVMVLLFGVVVVRLAYVQVLGASQYVAYGDEQRIRPIEVAGGRGEIFDRNGNDLAISIPRTTVAADPSVIPQPVVAAHRLGPVLGVDERVLRARLNGPGRFVYLARQVDDRTEAAVKALKIPGVLTFAEQARFNPAGDMAHGLLGEVGVDNTGLSGIEAAYNRELQGRNGKLIVERDLSGRTIPAGRHQIDPAVPGDDLILTLDGSLQYTVEGILARQIGKTGAQGGIAIVSDPETGEVLAVANQQRNPKTGVVGNSGNDLAVTANYEPGSVNKLITLSAALEEGLVTPETVIHVPPALRVADHTYLDDHAGDLTVTDILAKSSNVGTIELAEQLGKARVDEYLRRFGFGRSTGLGLPHEETGQLLPLDRWSGTSIGSIPIGQGISVTAMQMLFAYNVIANDGVYVPPSLVRATVDKDGHRHPVAPGPRRRVVSPTTAAQMRAMLTQVIASGTGKAAAIDGYDAAGKTGTARKPQPGGGYRDAKGKYHYISTFAGFLPADDPKLSMIVVIDEPSGSPFAAQVAAPAFADIGRNALRLLGVPPAARARAPLAVDPAKVRAWPVQAPTTAPPPTSSTSTTVPGTPGPTITPATGATSRAPAGRPVATVPGAGQPTTPAVTGPTAGAGPPPGD